jgi:hypothetical protein
MKGSGVMSTLAVLLSLATSVPAFAGDVTVGRLYSEIVSIKRIPASNAVTAEAELRRAGVELPTLALDKHLTEADLVAISKSLGLSVTTNRPSVPVSEGQMRTFLTGFGSQIAAPSLKGGTIDTPFQTLDLPPQASKGKGKKKGHNKSSAEPI